MDMGIESRIRRLEVKSQELPTRVALDPKMCEILRELGVEPPRRPVTLGEALDMLPPTFRDEVLKAMMRESLK